MVQPLLPQTLLCNEKLLSLSLHAELQTMCASIIRLWRRQSAWLDTAGLIRILEDVATVVSSLVPKRQGIVSMDAYRVQLDRRFGVLVPGWVSLCSLVQLR